MNAKSKILLVDDEQAITDNLSPFLERAGFTVTVAADGEEALRQVPHFSPDLIILDTTPTLAVTDAAVLAKGMDGVLLVVNAGKTWREVAQHAVENLRQVGANVVGVVLNAVPTQTGSYYHYYHREYDQDDGGNRRHNLRRLARRLATVRRPFDV